MSLKLRGFGERAQKFDDFFAALNACVRGGLLERRDVPVVHIRSGERDVAQSGDADAPTMALFENTGPAWQLLHSVTKMRKPRRAASG